MPDMIEDLQRLMDEMSPPRKPVAFVVDVGSAQILRDNAPTPSLVPEPAMRLSGSTVRVARDLYELLEAYSDLKKKGYDVQVYAPSLEPSWRLYLQMREVGRA